MGAFEYRVLDSRGRSQKGMIEGDTARQVRQQLREQGYTPLQVEPVAQREQRSQRATIGLSRSISATDLALITRQLATLTRAALPLEQVLQTVAQQSEKVRLKRILLAVRTRVVEGHTLADGLAQFPHVFHELYRSTVAAGEQSGHLDVVLERLADYTEKRQQMHQRIALALFYPLILTAVAILVVLALMTYVVPQVVQVFDNIGQDLPALTVGLIAVSDFLRQQGVWLIGVIVTGVVIANRLLRRPALRLRWHRLLHRLPLIGRLMTGINTARFTRTFSILAASGVPVLDALRISAEVITSLPMREAVIAASQRVREGRGIARALEETGRFPPMTLQLIASGEAGGRLEVMLERAAENQERELETIIAFVMGLFEPLLILGMGAVVLVIVLAILLPIFDLNQLVR
jgi:general secretion pathway protein F